MVDADLKLKDISDALNVPLQQIRDLNPQYKNDIIPGKSEAYSLKLPVNLVTTFIQMEDTIAAKSKESMLKYSEVSPSRNYLQISPTDDIIKINYKAKKGDNFSSIAKKYKVDEEALKEWNHMRKKKIKAGQKLIIYTTKKGKPEKKEPKPFVSGNNELKSDTSVKENADSEKPASEIKNKKNKAVKKEKAEAKPKTIIYKVKKGDTLSSISRKYNNIAVNDIIEWNKLGKNGIINAGQELKIKIQD
jgi:membrane-bound lytic murein transglycosylase D